MNYYVTVSFLNLLCYVLLGAARFWGHPTLIHVSMLSAVASLYFTVKMLLFYRSHKDDAPQGTVFRICFSFVCIIFFFTYYAMDMVGTAG